MEELLNDLIGLGWKPWGLNIKKMKYEDIGFVHYFTNAVIPNDNSLNDLCSIDSGLWQFVVEKKLLHFGDNLKYLYTSTTVDDEVLGLEEETFDCNNIEYRLMLSSIQEDKGAFILENIKING